MILQKNKIYLGNALPLLESFPSASINQCVTSPPYYGLRTYNARVQWNGWTGELGLEPTIKMYIEHLMLIFNQVKRILRKDGSCWVVIADSYSDKTKSLLLIPERFVIAMRYNGWIVRSKPIWQKGNVMTSSAKDRYTIDYENLFVFTKSQKYYWKTQYQPYAKSTLSQIGTNYQGQGLKDYEDNNVQNPSDVKRRIIASMNRKKLPRFGGNKQAGGQNATYSGKEWVPSENGSLKRTVWKINTKGSDIAHYAVYPEELVRNMVDAGSPERGTVIDPFSGSGTTCLVALKMKRSFIGIDANKKYCDIANDRIEFIRNVLD
jgi:DNA modification methylase